ncbi:unnamed protein product [Ambrosiozyma monospora]|uniref:RNA exonuclease 4 n=1 Tax=Ambrosiozyma monospora TaxID=43982 RepID=A0A9W6YYM7_AMBMO|nr:unnamed protein product [Ambrosiozyma monospora]
MSSISSNWKRLQKKSKKSTKNPKSSHPKQSNTTKDQPEPHPPHSNDNIPTTQRQKEVGKYLAIDCEFVGVGPEGVSSELARVSIVNYHGHTIYDKFVKPTHKVTDWRTWVSGITSRHMAQAIPFKQAQTETSNLIEGKVLVGHAIEHDLEALCLSHPKFMIRDTAKHTPFKKKYGGGKTPSLKKLSEAILKEQIQSGSHSSVEDARATMLIYRSDKVVFEKLHDLKFGKGKKHGDGRSKKT